MRVHVFASALVVAFASSCNLARPADVFPSDTLLTLSASTGVLDPPFAPETLEYDLDLVLAEPDTALMPVATVVDDTAITIDGNPLDSGAASTSFALAVGETRDIHLVLTRVGGKVRTYTIHAHRGVDGLASLSTSKGILSPVFDAAAGAYSVGLHLGDSTVEVTPTLLFPDRAALSLNGSPIQSGTPTADLSVSPGPNAESFVVAPKTRTARTYDLEIVRGTDALGAIRLSFAGAPISNPLEPVFDPSTASYTVHVGAWIQRLSIAAVPFVGTSTVTVAGDAVNAGTESSPRILNTGLTKFPVEVIASDNARTTYMVNVVRDGVSAQRSKLGKFAPQSPVAMFGDTLVVGMPYDASAAVGVDGDETDISAPNAGAAYVYTRSGDTWTRQAYLKASNTGAYDGFGYSVAIWGDTIAIGASGEDSGATGINGNQSDDSVNTAGAVYVFTRTKGVWSQQAYIKASNTGAHDAFGGRVALWKNTLAVSAVGEQSAATGIDGDQSDNSRNDAGAVYILDRTGTTWSQSAYIKQSTATPVGNRFGNAISLWEDTLAVGAEAEKSKATGINGDENDVSQDDSGAVYVFGRKAGAWSQQAYIKAPDTESRDFFGAAVALSNDTLVVGAPGEDGSSSSTDTVPDNNAPEAGAAYVYQRVNGTWTYLKGEGYLKPPFLDPGDNFGWIVAIWGDEIVIGAPQESSNAVGIDGDGANNDAPSSGAAYVFLRTPNLQNGSKLRWNFQNYLKEDDTAKGDVFGGNCPVGGTTVQYPFDSGGITVWGDTVAIISFIKSEISLFR